MLPLLSFPSTNHSLQFSTVNLPSLHKSTTVRCHSATATSLVPPPVASLYEVLGVCWNASPSEIKVAYRRLAKSYHPDALSPSPEECDRRSFVEINRAYETLSDSNARAVYDLSIGLGRSDATSFGGGCSSVIVGSSGFRVNPTRRWETDQCW